MSTLDKFALIISTEELHVMKYNDAMKLKDNQAGVGKLLYLTRWSSPEIGSSVRELSKFSSKPQMSHQSATERVMNFASTIRVLDGH
jgi:hypothetical protein